MWCVPFLAVRVSTVRTAKRLWIVMDFLQTLPIWKGINLLLTHLLTHSLTHSLAWRYTLTLIVEEYSSNFVYWNGITSCSVESIESNTSFQLGEYFTEKILMVHKPVFRVGYQGDIGVVLLPLLGAYLLTYSLTHSLTYWLRLILRGLLCAILLPSSSLCLLFQKVSV